MAKNGKAHDWRRDIRRANPRLSMFKNPTKAQKRNAYEYGKPLPINRLVTREPVYDSFLTGNGPWKDDE